jgi:hypothetical protein
VSNLLDKSFVDAGFSVNGRETVDGIRHAKSFFKEEFGQVKVETAPFTERRSGFATTAYRVTIDFPPRNDS